jgi:hypothetical protein
MDSMIIAAARALSAGDPLGALKRVALRDDAPALALRGIAMAQLGDHSRAKALLRRAGRAFGARESVARARCVVAEAEIALASRDLGFSTKLLEAARLVLERHGDLVNAAHAQYLSLRRLLLLGRIDEAERLLTNLNATSFPPPLRAAHELVVAGIAMRRLRAKDASVALEAARRAAERARIPSLIAEVDSSVQLLRHPVARLIARGAAHPVSLGEVEAIFASEVLAVDACRFALRTKASMISLATRPILFSIVRALAEAWPREVPRATLIERAFQIKHADESLRARLRVEVGRLRKIVASVADVNATKDGFVLASAQARNVIVLENLVEEEYASILALLADGEAWSSSALALALGSSQRNVQRALESLAAAAKAQSFGQGRARRWMAPAVPGFTTALLLPTSFTTD